MKTTKFKLSEIGPIPEEWEVKRLGDIWSSFRTGPFGSSLHAQDYVCNGTPLVNPMHIVNGSIVPSAEMSVDSATVDRLAAYKLSVNDIVIGRRGEMGRAAIVRDKEKGWLCGTGCFYFHLKEMASPEFVVRYLRTPTCVSVLEGEAVGTTLVNLNQTILGRVNIPVPPRAEQEKIAAALSDVDELLAAMTTLIKKKRAIKQGAMQELLEVRPTALTQRAQSSQRDAKCFSHGERGERGEREDCFKTGLTGFTGLRDDSRVEVEKSRKNSASGSGAEPQLYTSTPLHGQDKNPVNPVNPVEKTCAPRRRLADFTDAWMEKRLGDVCQIIMGQSPASCFYNQNGAGLPLIQGNADIENRKSIVRFYTSQIIKTCDVGDIILSVRAPVGAVGKASYRSCLGRGVCALKANCDFLYQYLLFVEDKWGEFSKGSTFDSINSHELANYNLSIPPTLAEQKAIAGVLADMDAEIAAMEAKRAKYEQVKQGMMQELLTGRLRLG